MNTTALSKAGVNYKSAITRCMGNAGLYERLLRMFLNDSTFSRAKEAYASDNREALFKCMHEMKGMCGNVDLQRLHEVSSQLVELLRAGKAQKDAIDVLFERVTDEYNIAVECVLLALNG